MPYSFYIFANKVFVRQCVYTGNRQVVENTISIRKTFLSQNVIRDRFSPTTFRHFRVCSKSMRLVQIFGTENGVTCKYF